jgi:hypothetical protein
MLYLQETEAHQVSLQEVSQICKRGEPGGPMGWSSRNRLPHSQTAGYDRNHVRPKGRIAKDGCGITVLVPAAWRFELKPPF